MDYEGLRKAIETRLYNLDIDFLLDLPQFAKWSKSAVKKLACCLTTLKCHKGDLVYQAGKTPKYLYIVKNGIFEMESQYTVKSPRERGFGVLLGPKNERERCKQFIARLASSKRHPDLNYSTEKHTLQVTENFDNTLA